MPREFSGEYLLPGVQRKSSSDMNSSLENLNDSQLEALKQLKKNIADVLRPDLSDIWLIKWLRCTNYNLKKTEALFRANVKCREIYGSDTILDTYVKPEVVSKYEFSCVMGIAKNGSPIRYSQIGRGDYMGFVKSLSGYQICMYANWLVEHDLAVLKKENERTGKNVTEITYINDMEGFCLHHMLYRSAIEMGFDLLKMMQDHYPEAWGNIFFINAPIYFDKFFNMFKPIINLHMLRKIRVVSKEATPTVLLKYIDEDVLPAFLGGKRVDSFGNPRCTEFMKFGSKVPEDLYLSSLPPLDVYDPTVTSLWVSARCCYNHSVVVRKKNSYIRVEIRTENGSIGLKMLFRPFDDNNPDNVDLPPTDEYLDETNPSSNVFYVSPFFRMQTHISPVDHKVKAPWPGIYIFRFDNTLSWFTSKKIIFRIRLLKDEI